MSFIVQSISQNPAEYPVTVYGAYLGPFFKGSTYTFNVTNFDSFTTYLISSIGIAATVTLDALGVITYTAAIGGATGNGGFQINDRQIELIVNNYQYWIAYQVTLTASRFYGLNLDPDGNIWLAGFENSSSAYFQTEKINLRPQFVADSCKALQSGSAATSARDVVYVAGDIVYTAGTNTLAFPSNQALTIAQYSSANDNLVLLWQRAFGSLTASNHVAQAVTANPSNQDVFVVGKGNLSGVDKALITRWNAAGTLQNEKRLSNIGTSEFVDIVFDTSSNNLIVAGRLDLSSYNQLLVCSINTSFAFNWAKTLDFGPLPSIATGVAVDNTGNVYVSGTVNAQSLIIAKFNNAGVLQWQRLVDSLGFTVTSGKIAVAPNGSFCYVIGSSNVFSDSDVIVLKYDGAGVLQWQRSLRSSSVNSFGFDIALDVNGTDYVLAGETNNPFLSNGLVARLPVDGSRTGTVTVGAATFIYSAATLTDNAATAVSTTQALSVTTSGASAISSTLALTSLNPIIAVSDAP